MAPLCYHQREEVAGRLGQAPSCPAANRRGVCRRAVVALAAAGGGVWTPVYLDGGVDRIG